MFKKLNRQIHLSIFYIATTFVLLISIISFSMISNSLYNTYVEMAKVKLATGINNCNIYLDSIRTSAQTLTQDEELIEKLTVGNSLIPSTKLDYLCTYSLRINGVVIYKPNGEFYSSSRVADIPSLDDLKGNNKIGSFIQSDESEMFSFRNDNIIKIYDNQIYDASYGIITYSAKIYDKDENVCGYLFADLKPSELYNKFLITTNDKLFGDIQAIISFPSGYLNHNKNQTYLSYLEEKNSNSAKLSNDLAYLIVNHSLMNSTEITLFLPLKDFYLNLALILAILIIVDIVLLLIVYFIAKKVAYNVTSRLDLILIKMTISENNDFTNQLQN